MALRTYAQELAAVAAVLEPRRVEARKWARPELWERLSLCLSHDHGYFVCGELASVRGAVYVGGVTESVCGACSSGSVIWPSKPCRHQLGLAALWSGGHPIAPESRDEAMYCFDYDLAAQLEGGAR